VSEAVDGLDFLKLMGYSAPTKKALHSLPDSLPPILESPFDVVLIDDNMPNLNGSEAVEIIRRLGHKGTILGITGDVDPSSVAIFKEKGVNAVLTKPIDMEELKAVIRTFLK
jgi:CheY-like chemotaxis protein